MDHNDNSQRQAFIKSIKFLSYRARSKQEIINYLNKKGFPSETINLTVKALEEENLINDHKFAAEWIQLKAQQGYGSIKLRHQLKAKGVDDCIIEENLSQILSEEEEYRLAKELLCKRKKRTENSHSTNRFWQKTANYLMSRGYPFSLVNKLIQKHRKDRL